MTPHFSSVGMGVALFIMNAGCASPTAPTSSRADAVGSAPAEMFETAATAPVVTLLPDLTVSPVEVTVSSGSRLKMTNNSGRSVRFQCYECSQFQWVVLPAGYTRYTPPFGAAGQICDYFVWDTNWSRKIFQGRVMVK